MAFGAAALSATAISLSTAWAQTGPNVVRDIRPLVDVSLQDPFPIGDPLALGLFDTGATAVFIPPQSNAKFGVNVATPGNPNMNYGVVGSPISLTVSGWLGGAVGGPEVFTPAVAPGLTRIFSTDSRRASTQGIQQTQIAPSLTYYNGTGIIVNIGMSFVAGVAGGAAPLVAEVDPLNASYEPFPFINAPAPPTDQTTSNISFFRADSGQVPTAALNDDKGFLASLPLAADDFVSAGTGFNRVQNASWNNATRTNRPTINLDVTNNNVFGRPLSTGTYVVDTGNPVTIQAAPMNGQPHDYGLLGTNDLNGFGQYFDFSRNSLLLFGPQNPADKALIGPGILFDVDRSAVGLAHTGVNQLSQFGIPPVLTAPNSTGNPSGFVNPNGSPYVRVVQRSIHDTHGEDCTDAAEGDAMPTI